MIIQLPLTGHCPESKARDAFFEALSSVFQVQSRKIFISYTVRKLEGERNLKVWKSILMWSGKHEVNHRRNAGWKGKLAN